jgi:hypothetical protein
MDIPGGGVEVGLALDGQGDVGAAEEVVDAEDGLDGDNLLGRAQVR